MSKLIASAEIILVSVFSVCGGGRPPLDIGPSPLLHTSLTLSHDMRKKTKYAFQARSHDAEKVAEEPEQRDPSDRSYPLADRGVYNTFVAECGNVDVPCETEFFDSAVKQIMGVEDTAGMPGFRRYAAVLRDAQLPLLFQDDEGASAFC